MQTEPGKAAVGEAAPATDGPILAAHELQAGYGEMAVVRDLDLEVNAGEVVALLGANGAGKTTTLLTLAGALPALGGEILWRGAATTAPLHKRARQGLRLLTEERSVFMKLTAAENIKIGRCDFDRAIELFPELTEHLDRPAGLLSGGQQQILTVARALAAAPAILLADELSLGLAPQIVDRLLATLRQEADERGLAVMLVEQQVHKALAVADTVYVLNRGQVVLKGEARELRENPDLLERFYLA
jgi:branched-chain amino acid transport system ATP-binding protein